MAVNDLCWIGVDGYLTVHSLSSDALRAWLVDRCATILHHPCIQAVSGNHSKVLDIIVTIHTRA